MKTFDEVLNELFKVRYDLSKGLYAITVYNLVDNIVTWPDESLRAGWKFRSSHLLEMKYLHSKDVLKPYRGRDIGEPVGKICKRILEKPYRFCSLKNQEQVTERSGSAFHFNMVELLPEIKILLDKDTQVKFVLKDGYIANLSYLTRDEQHLLGECIEEWYDSNRELIEHKKQNEEQKRKDKYRQEMIDQYKDL